MERQRGVYMFLCFQISQAVMVRNRFRGMLVRALFRYMSLGQGQWKTLRVLESQFKQYLGVEGVRMGICTSMLRMLHDLALLKYLPRTFPRYRIFRVGLVVP